MVSPKTLVDLFLTFLGLACLGVWVADFQRSLEAKVARRSCLGEGLGGMSDGRRMRKTDLEVDVGAAVDEIG